MTEKSTTLNDLEEISLKIEAELPDELNRLVSFRRDEQTGNLIVDWAVELPPGDLKLCRAGLNAKAYTYKREDGLRELGSRFSLASDGQPRQYVSKRCVNLISELLEYREDVKVRDHAVDAIRYSLPIVPVCSVTVRRAVVR